MAQFSTHAEIEAPINRVWDALADIGNIYQWNPGVIKSHVTSEVPEGIGASRYCDLGSGNYLDEEVVEWSQNQALTMRIVGTSLPFRKADIRFKLQEDNASTIVNVSPEYELRYGVIGWLLDLVFVRRTYQRGMQNLLSGLKAYVEAGSSA
jgi:uncharacterized protein YndB with AHSA1/START domain